MTEEVIKAVVGTVLYENEHYKVLVPAEPRVVDGVPLNYEMYNKVSGVVEGYAQIYPQAVNYVDDWSDMISRIARDKEAQVFSIVKN